MEYEIIDFHTHPFLSRGTNICSHIDYCDMSAENTKKDLMNLGINRICGSVIGTAQNILTANNTWSKIKACNNEALQLRDMYGDFYIPGFHIHPGYIKESCEEIERMHKRGIRLVGELVPYWHEWSDYSCKEFSELLDVCEDYNMVVSFHSMGNDQMDKMVENHKNIVFVAAHPGEYDEFMLHMERMKNNENYYLDLSGYGLFRYGMLRHALDKFGAERFLFGSDYPTCNPSMYIGGIYFDNLILDKEKEMIFSRNAKRLLEID